MGVVNMLKIYGTTFLVMLAVVVRSEPPVNSYLPPRTSTSANGGRTDLSTQYGAPDFNNRGVNRNGGATSFGGPGAGNGPSKLYDVPIGGNVGGNGLDQFQGSGFGGGQPSSSYGTPISGFDKNHDNSGRPQTSYGVPDVSGNNNRNGFRNVGNEGKPLSSYGVPSTSGNNDGSFGSGDIGKRPSTNYGVPGASGKLGDDFGSGDIGGRPSTSYGVPGRNGNHRGGNAGDEKPSSNYGVPGANRNTNGKDHFNGNNGEGSSNENRFGGGLTTSYGPPDRGENDRYSSGSNRENFVNGGVNGYPFGDSNGNAGIDLGHGDGRGKKGGGKSTNGGYNDKAQEESTKPTKYEFSYKVKDQQTGSDYSHTETRDGDRAQGEFNVLLPDGRKQIVEYEADQDGFKPQIRYEGEANAGGEYGSGGPNNNDGYSSGRPSSESGGITNYSGFNRGGSNGGYPSGSLGEGKLGFNSGGSSGYQSGKPAGQFFGRDNDGGLSDDIGGYFSNPPSNNIGGSDNANIGSNRQNNGNNGYQY